MSDTCGCWYSAEDGIPCEHAQPFKPGDRIELGDMPNDPCPIERGSQGTVEHCAWLAYDRTWQVIVKWDSGRSLNLVMPPDRAHVIGVAS
jgi:hypothetical protein